MREQAEMVLNKAVYAKDILDCPYLNDKKQPAKFLVENKSRVAVYFDDNKWYEGTVAQVHKQYVNIKNVTVRFDDDSMHNFMWNHRSQYGKDKQFVLIPESSFLDEEDVDQDLAVVVDDGYISEDD